jgi:hypothetical protein
MVYRPVNRSAARAFIAWPATLAIAVTACPARLLPVGSPPADSKAPATGGVGLGSRQQPGASIAALGPPFDANHLALRLAPGHDRLSGLATSVSQPASSVAASARNTAAAARDMVADGLPIRG